MLPKLERFCTVIISLCARIRGRGRILNSLQLYVNCNDENGHIKPCINALTIARGDRYPIISLNSWEDVSFQYAKNNICYFNKTPIPFIERHLWCGSIIWDMVEISPQTAIALLSLCQKLNRESDNQFWACEDAETEVCEIWDNGDFRNGQLKILSTTQR